MSRKLASLSETLHYLNYLRTENFINNFKKVFDDLKPFSDDIRKKCNFDLTKYTSEDIQSVTVNAEFENDNFRYIESYVILFKDKKKFMITDVEYYPIICQTTWFYDLMIDQLEVIDFINRCPKILLFTN